MGLFGPAKSYNPLAMEMGQGMWSQGMQMSPQTPLQLVTQMAKMLGGALMMRKQGGAKKAQTEKKRAGLLSAYQIPENPTKVNIPTAMGVGRVGVPGTGGIADTMAGRGPEMGVSVPTEDQHASVVKALTEQTDIESPSTKFMREYIQNADEETLDAIYDKRAISLLTPEDYSKTMKFNPKTGDLINIKTGRVVLRNDETETTSVAPGATLVTRDREGNVLSTFVNPSKKDKKLAYLSDYDTMQKTGLNIQKAFWTDGEGNLEPAVDPTTGQQGIRYGGQQVWGGPFSSGKGSDGVDPTRERQRFTKEMLTAEQNVALQNVTAAFRPEFLTWKGKAKDWWFGVKDKINPDLLNDEEREWYSDYVTFERQVSENINNYIKAITGAQMSMYEIERIMKAMPNLGDTPTEFESKLGDALTTYGNKLVRYQEDYREKGYSPDVAGAMARHKLRQDLGLADAAGNLIDEDGDYVNSMGKKVSQPYSPLQSELELARKMQAVRGQGVVGGGMGFGGGSSFGTPGMNFNPTAQTTNQFGNESF